VAKRLAITIAGAVSLGSYEAGVLCEVLEAIRQHNIDAATTPDQRIEIDVLTGASAGGMTAIILGQKLLYNADEFVGPYDNPVYHCWVQRISLEALQQTQPDEPALLSLFSSDLIEQISREMLKDRYKNDPAPPPDPVPHPAAAKAIRLGVALTNLNGVDYGYPVKPDNPDGSQNEFIYIRYGDQRTRFINGPPCDKADFWEPLRQAAVACGAFPFAFRSQDVQRSAKDEPFDYPAANLEPWDHDPQIFTYSDGGILQNQPLGLAKNLVDLIDNHNDQENRYYLFVSPNAKDATANDNFHAANADYFHLLQRLTSVVIGQSEFQDWITAEDLNKRIKLLDDRATGLKEAILAGKIDVPALQTTATSLLVLFFPNGVHNPPGSLGPETLDQAKDRIAGQYGQERNALAAVPGQADTFRDAVLAFETAAGLGARDHMEIYGVTAMDTELAGAGLSAFLGFFDQTFRDHDYDVGRTHARSVLSNPALSAHGAIGPLNWNPALNPIRPIDHRLDGLKMSHVPNDDLQEFKDGAKQRVNQMLRELIGKWSILADPAADGVISIALDQVIAKL
jgi:hypothetical protein